MIRTLGLSLFAVALAAMPAHADHGDRWDGGTMALQAGGGLLGATIGATVVGTLGLVIGSKFGHRSDWGAPLAGALTGAVVGGLTGQVIGIDLTGEARGSTGHWWGTTLGALAGGLAIGGLAYLRPTSKPGRIALLVTGSLVLLAAPVIGYQLTADLHAQPASTPLVALTF